MLILGSRGYAASTVAIDDVFTWECGSQDAHDAVETRRGNEEAQLGQRDAQAQGRQHRMGRLGHLQLCVQLAPLQHRDDHCIPTNRSISQN